MNLLQQAILRSKLASQTPPAAAPPRPEPEPPPPPPPPKKTIIPIRSIEDSYLDIWRQNEEYRRIIRAYKYGKRVGSIDDHPDEPPAPTFRCIKDHVAAAYKISVPEMLSQRKEMKVCRPRQLAMYFCRMMTGHSMPEIGRRFGGRDHTTVICAVRKITQMRAEDPKFDARVAELQAKIQQSVAVDNLGDDDAPPQHPFA